MLRYTIKLESDNGKTAELGSPIKVDYPLKGNEPELVKALGVLEILVESREDDSYMELIKKNISEKK